VNILAASIGIERGSFKWSGKYTLSMHFDDGTATILAVLSNKIIEGFIGLGHSDFTSKLALGEEKQIMKKKVMEMELKVFHIDMVLELKYSEKSYPKPKIVSLRNPTPEDVRKLLSRIQRRK